jgi:hypothetical protein
VVCDLGELLGISPNVGFPGNHPERYNMIEIPLPEMFEVPPPAGSCLDVEEHQHREHIIRIEFYKNVAGRYFVWPYIKQVYQSGDTIEHFQVIKEFANKDAARQTALDRGRELIDRN